MTEREDKTPVAPSGAAEEQEILLDSPIVESEDEPGAVDAPGVSGSKEPDEAAVESTPVVEEDAVEPVPPVEEAIAGNPEAAASADADASAGLPEIPEGASSAWPQEETLPAPAAGGEPPAPVDPPSGEEEEPEEERPMTLLEHLGELRKRLVRGFLAILIDPMPLSGGVHKGNIVLLTRFPERQATAAGIERAVLFLSGVMDTVAKA